MVTETSPYHSSATLRLRSDLVRAEDITEALGTNASKIFVKGSKAVPGHPRSYVYPKHMWILESGLDKSQPLEAHIEKLVEFIEGKQLALRELLKTCDVDVFCGFSSVHGQGGFSLDSNLMKRLTLLPIKLIVDLYPPS